MMATRKLAITATQHLRKRLDRLDATITAQGSRLDAIEQRMQNLAQDLSKSLHVGNYEAMYRLEREENIKLRAKIHGVSLVDRDVLLGWIHELDRLCALLNSACSPPSRSVEEASDAVLVEREQILIEKLGSAMSDDGLGTWQAPSVENGDRHVSP